MKTLPLFLGKNGNFFLVKVSTLSLILAIIAGMNTLSCFCVTTATSSTKSFIFIFDNLVPSISLITPTSKCAGDAAFTLTVDGSDFNEFSLVYFNGNARATTFVSVTQLTAAILASDITAGGNYDITVINPDPGGGTSSPSTFTVNALPIVTITGSTSICVGAMTTVSSNMSGTWVCNNTTAYVTNRGEVIGISAGSANFTFTAASTGCSSTTDDITIIAIPVVSITGNTSICVGSTTTLSPTTGGTWTSNNASASVTDAGVVTGLSAGTGTFTFTETNTGCSNTTGLIINSLPLVSITGSTLICVGATTTLSPTTGGTWMNNNASASVTNTGVVTGVSAGSLTFTFTKTSNGCSNTTSTVTVIALPTVNAGDAVDVICQGGTTEALGGSFGGGATAAIWDDGGAPGIFSNNAGNTPGTATYTSPAYFYGTITLTLIAYGYPSCGTVSASKQLVVYQNPTANAGGAIPPICQGGTSVPLGGSFGGSATAAVWNDGGAGGSFTNNTGSTPGMARYTSAISSGSNVTLTLTTSGGPCGTISASKQVIINQGPTVNAGNAIASICPGGTTEALGGSFGGGATAAVWSSGAAGGTFTNNNGNTPNTAIYTPSPFFFGIVTLTLTTYGGTCGITSASKQLLVSHPTVYAGGQVPYICQGGTTAALGGSFGGDATAAIWDDGGAGGNFANNSGNTPGTATYTASLSSGSLVTLTLTAYGSLCGTASASKQLVVIENPTVNAGEAVAAICQGGTTAALGGSFGGGANGAIWNDGGAGGHFYNNTGSTPNTAKYSASPTSDSPIILTLTASGNYCGTISASKLLVVNQNPTVDAGGSIVTICQGETTEPLGGSFGGGATAAVWTDGEAGGSFTNNTGSTPDIATYTAYTYASYVTLTLTANGGSCGMKSASKQLFVNHYPIVFAGGSVNAICQGGTTSALGGSCSGSAHGAVWDDGGAGGFFSNNTGNTPNIATYTASASSNSPVTLTLTSIVNACGTASASKQLIVNQNPTATATKTDVPCKDGTNGIVTITPTSGTPNYSFKLYPGNYSGGPQSGAYSFTGLPANTYEWRMKDAGTCTAHGSITVDEPPALIATINTSSVSHGQTLTLDAVVSGGTGGYTYAWSGNAYTGSGEPPIIIPIASPEMSGLETLTVTDEHGCTVLASVYVIVYGSMIWVNDDVITYRDITFTEGDDNNPGTRNLPLRHINFALSVAQPGDTIHTDVGTYHEKVIIDKAVQVWGAWHKYSSSTCLRTDPEIQSIIDVTGFTSPNVAVEIRNPAGYAEINGFTIHGSKSAYPMTDATVITSGFQNVVRANIIEGYYNVLSNGSNNDYHHITENIILAQKGGIIVGPGIAPQFLTYTSLNNISPGTGAEADASGILIVDKDGFWCYNNDTIHGFIGGDAVTSINSVNVWLRNSLFYENKNGIDLSGDGILTNDKIYNNSEAGVKISGNIVTIGESNIYENGIGVHVYNGGMISSCTENSIINNPNGGIIIEADAGAIGDIEGNTISGNGYAAYPSNGIGLSNQKTTMINVKENWWGTASGPYNNPNNTCGQGNSVTANVDFMPWFTDAEMTINAGMLPVHNTTKETYYCKIQDAIDDANPTDTISVAPGTYNEYLTISKPLSLLGNGGSGEKPVIQGIVDNTHPALLTLNVFPPEWKFEYINLENLKFIPTHAATDNAWTSAILIPIAQFGRHPLISDCDFIPGQTTFSTNSHAIRIGTPGTEGGSWFYVLYSNILPNAGNVVFGYGIRSFDIGGQMIENTIYAECATQHNDPGYLRMWYCNLYGHNEYVRPKSEWASVIRNIYRPLGIYPNSTKVLFELKDNSTGTPFSIDNNTFENYYYYGLLCTHSKEATVWHNNFHPALDATNDPVAIHFNTKQRTNEIEGPEFTNKIYISGNILWGTAAGTGIGLEFANHNSGIDPPFIVENYGMIPLTIRFITDMSRFIVFDPSTGPSTSAEWSDLWDGCPETTMTPCNFNFDVSLAHFYYDTDPIYLTVSKLFEVEDKIQHNIDYEDLGHAKVLDDIFVTPNSFLSDYTATPSIQRGIDAAVTSACTVYIQGNTLTTAYTGGADATATGKNITLSPGASSACVYIDGDLKLNSGDFLEMDINGHTDNCMLFDKLIVNGNVNLEDNTGSCALSLSGSYTANNGEEFTLIDNQGSNPVSGQFSTNTYALNGRSFVTDYAAGNGNDVVLKDCDAEINVSGNMVTILTGDMTPGLDDGTDFGQPLPAVPVTQSYTIENTGTASLSISSITLNGLQASSFSLGGITLPATLNAGNSVNFSITFLAVPVGIYDAIVTIVNDDCDEASYDFAIRGEVSCQPAIFSACPSNIIANTDPSQCNAIITYTTTASGEPDPELTYTFSGATNGSGSGSGSGAAFDIGETTVTISAMNVCGNAECTFKVTVVDNTPPTAICQDVTVTLDNSGNASTTAAAVDNGSNDACGIRSLSLDKTDFSCADIATSPKWVTLTVTDNNDNVNTCSSLVTINGVIPSCMMTAWTDSTIYTANPPGRICLGYGPDTVYLNVTATGGGPFTYEWSGLYLTTSGSEAIFNPSDPGTYELTCTVTNIYGCRSSCSVQICVLDIRDGWSNGEQKVLLCHDRHNNPVTLSIGVSAVSGHLLNHPNDMLGYCGQTCSNNIKLDPATFISQGSETEEIKIAVLPNPFRDITHFEFDIPEEGSLTLRLIDINGRIIGEPIADREVNASLITQDINLQSFSPGVYSWVVTFIGGKKCYYQSGRLVIAR